MRYYLSAALSVGGQLTSLGLSFIFHFLIARLLGVALYGDFGVLLSAFTILIFPITSIQIVVMREVANYKTNNKDPLKLINQLIPKIFVFGIILSIMILVEMHFLGLLNHPIETIIMLASVPLLYTVFLYNGYLQGMQKPLHFVAFLVAIDAIRLILSYLLITLGFSLMAISISYLVAGALLFLIILFKMPKTKKSEDLSFLNSLSRVFPTYLLMSSFLAIDIFFLQKYSGSAEAGLYNSALTLARAVFYAGIGLMNALLPEVTINKKGVLNKVLISTIPLFLFALVLAYLSNPLLTLLYGLDFSQASTTLSYLAFSMFFLSSALVFTNILWANNDNSTPLLIFGAGLGVLVLLHYLNLGLMSEQINFASTALAMVLSLAFSIKYLRK